MKRKWRLKKNVKRFLISAVLFVIMGISVYAAATNYYDFTMTSANSRQSETNWQYKSGTVSNAPNGYAFYEDAISGYTASGMNNAGSSAGCSVTDLCDVSGSYAAGYQANITNTATFKTIKFNNNGGSGSMADLRIDGTGTLTANTFTHAGGSDTLTVTYNVNGGGTVTPASSTATKTISYTYDGWATSAGGTKVYDDEDTITPAGDMTLFAHWNQSSSTSTIILPTPSRSGYDFLGWYLEEGCINKAGNGGAGYIPDQSRTLYANWALKTYTVTYDANGGTGAPASQTKTYGTPLTLSSTTPSKANTSGSWTVNFAAGTHGTGTGVSGNTKSATTTTTYSFTDWTSSADSVHYNAGGTYSYEAATTMSANYSSSTTCAAISLPTPTGAAGYSFAGWYDGSTRVGGAGDSYTPTVNNKTLTAHWNTVNYTIEYTLNGGTVSADNPTSYNVESAAITLRNPTRTGYTFKGWSGTGLTGDTNTSVTIASGSTGNRSYTANWTANTNVSYKVNHYTKNLGASSYLLNSYENKTDGTADGSVTLSSLAKSITGFTYDEGFAGTADSGTTKPGSGAVATTTILPDGTRVINLYYSRNTHDVVLAKETGISSVTGAATGVEFGASVTINASLSAGYNWSKWTVTSGGAEVTTTKNYTFTMPDSDVRYTANAVLKTYTVSYDANGGTGAPASQTKTHGTPLTLSSTTPSKASVYGTWTVNFAAGTHGTGTGVLGDAMTSTATTAYSFNNWTSSADSANYSAGGTYSYEADTTMTANYSSSTTCAAITLPTPTGAAGYTFDGWYDGSTKAGDAGESYAPSADGKTLTAHWSADSYTITYALNPGTGSTTPVHTSPKTSYTVEDAAFTLVNPTRVGYTFAGWTGSNGETPETTVTIPQGTTGNKSYTANWTADNVTYNIVYESTSGTRLDTDTVTHAFDTTNTVEAISITGYTKPADQSVSWNALSKTITFVYTPIQYLITYELDGGTNDPDNPDRYTIESSAIVFEDPEKTNYTFQGWYDAAEGGSEMTGIPAGSTGSVVVYARWTANNYVVTLNPNGGTGLVETEYEVPVGETLDVPFNLTKPNSIFVGWSDGTTTYEPENGHCYYTPSGDVTLNAVWQSTGTLTITETFTYRNDSWGIPSFIYEIDGTANVTGESVHRVLILTASSGLSVSGAVSDLPYGSYSVRRLSNARYVPDAYTKSVTLNSSSASASYTGSIRTYGLFGDMRIHQ